MKLILVPPKEGLVWVRRGFQVFFRQPLGFASLFAVCALVFFVLLRVPFVGEPILLVIAPVGSLLFMIASRLSAAGERPVPGAFVELASADRTRIVGMLKLGVAYLVAALLAIGLIAAVEGDALVAFMEAAGNPKRRRRSSPTRACRPDSCCAWASVPSSRFRSGMRRASSTGARRAGPRRCSSAPSPSGATRARSRSTGSSGPASASSSRCCSASSSAWPARCPRPTSRRRWFSSSRPCST
jgi:hypothetical protein